MGIPVLVLGKSGSGKSRSIKNFKREEVCVIKAIEKLLPFRNNLYSRTLGNYDAIKGTLLEINAPSFVIDDAGYLMTTEYLSRGNENGYGKFSDIAKRFYELVQFITYQLPPEKIIYIMMHEDVNDITGEVKPKTVGKMLNDTICIEGMFTIALRCVNDDLTGHKFITNGKGAKTPEEMFETNEIENDLKFVDDKIREYYNIPRSNLKKENKEAKETKEEGEQE